MVDLVLCKVLHSLLVRKLLPEVTRFAEYCGRQEMLFICVAQNSVDRKSVEEGGVRASRKSSWAEKDTESTVEAVLVDDS